MWIVKTWKVLINPR